MRFYIIKRGVYLHGIYGPYETTGEAIAAFNSAYRQSSEDCRDFDGHHDYYVVQGLGSCVGQSMHVGGEPIAYEPKL